MQASFLFAIELTPLILLLWQFDPNHLFDTKFHPTKAVRWNMVKALYDACNFELYFVFSASALQQLVESQGFPA